MQILQRFCALLAAVTLLGWTTGLAQIPTIARGTTSTSGAIGSSITIAGTNFSTTPANNLVRFGGGVKGTVTVASATVLTVTVPVGASYGKLSVTVGGLTAYSPNYFAVTFAYSGVIDTTMFAAPVSYTAGTWPAMIDVGDLDGDGKPDVLVSNNEPSGSSVSVFRNTSTKGVIDAGSFAVAANFPTTASGRPWGVGVGDFDGDGKLDFAVVNGSTNTVSIFKNTSSGPGTISFAAKIDSATGPLPHDMVVADIDMDGKPDIILTNYNGGGAGSISVLRNTSTSGNISFAAHVDIPVGNGPRGLAVGDIDVDGLPDIAVACYDGGTLYLLKNASSPGVISFEDKGALTAALTPVSVTINDFDGDGLPDVMAAGYGEGIYIYRAEGSFGGWESAYVFHKGPGQGSVTGADVNGDGKPDVVTANALESSFTRGTISVFRNLQPGSGSFTTTSFSDSVNFTLPSLPYQAAVVDIDGDGRPDLLGANIYKTSLSVLRNRSGDTLSITATASANGTIAPAGTIKVPHGNNQAFTITPGGGAHTDSVVIDGVNQHVLSAYTFDSVAVNHTIAAYFSTGTVWAITSSAGPGGTISPLGVVNVPNAGGQTYTIAANPGLVLDTLYVDGVKVASASSYPFTNVTAAHTIRAVFTTGVKVGVAFFLQGPAVSDTMSNGLKTGGMLAARFVGAKIPTLAVDSVTIEARDQQTAAGSTIRVFAGAWLKSNGSIANYADTTLNYVSLNVPTGSYYLVVRHRNHVAVMSAAAVALSGTAATYDFSTGQAKAFGTAPMVLVGTKYCLYAGDTDLSGTVDAADRSAAWNQRNLSGYYGEDCDLSGTCDAADRSITWNSRNVSTQVP